MPEAHHRESIVQERHRSPEMVVLTIRDDGTFNNRPQESSALLESETFQSAPNRVDQAESGCLKCELGRDWRVVDIVRNILFKKADQLG